MISLPRKWLLKLKKIHAPICSHQGRIGKVGSCLGLKASECPPSPAKPVGWQQRRWVSEVLLCIGSSCHSDQVPKEKGCGGWGVLQSFSVFCNGRTQRGLMKVPLAIPLHSWRPFTMEDRLQEGKSKGGSFTEPRCVSSMEEHRRAGNSPGGPSSAGARHCSVPSSPPLWEHYWTRIIFLQLPSCSFGAP